MPEDVGAQKRWAAAGRIVMAIVVLGNTVGLAANVAAAVYYQKFTEAESTASYYPANSTNAASNLLEIAGKFPSVQSFCEVAVLLLIIISFFVVGALFMRRLRASMLMFDAAAQRASMGRAVRLQLSDAAATGRALRLQMLGTTGFIFVTYLLRSVASSMAAIAFALRNVGMCPETESFCESTCNNQYSHIAEWLFQTPEFDSVIVLISSPVAQLVALWGMTTKSTLQFMKNSSSWEKASAIKLVQPNEEAEEECCQQEPSV